MLLDFLKGISEDFAFGFDENGPKATGEHF